MPVNAPLPDVAIGLEAEDRFVVTYDGPDLESGRMDARALGGAMIALAQLIDASAGVTLGAGTPVHTEISADFKAGSFTFLVVVANQTPLSGHLLHTMTIKDLLGALGVVGGGGLIGLVKFLGGKPPRKLEAATKNDTTVTNEHGQQLVVNARTVTLLNNPTVRFQLDGVVAPLREGGITDFRAGRPGEPPIVVQSSDVEYFEPPPAEGEQLQDKVTTEIIQIVTVNFSPGRKWMFRTPDGTTFYSALDDVFAKRVGSRQIKFGAGDALEVDLRTIVYRDASGSLRADRAIQRVRREIEAPKQLPFDFTEPEDAAGERPSS